MAATKKEMTDLMWDHEAIRAHMRFLIKSLKNLATHADPEKKPSAQLKDQIRLYRWSLYDFREAARHHIEADEHIFQAARGPIPTEDLEKEHEEIRDRLDNPIQLAERAVYKKLSRKELEKCALNIQETVSIMCEICEAHMAKEDALLKQMLKDS